LRGFDAFFDFQFVKEHWLLTPSLLQLRVRLCSAARGDNRAVVVSLFRRRPADGALNPLPRSCPAQNLPSCRVGGAKEDRTPDLLRARQALSQLSYGPVLCPASVRGEAPLRALDPAAFFLFDALFSWWVWEELNLRPHPYQGCALTN
jgi:hypothetical protein